MATKKCEIRILDHTGDIGIIVICDTLPNLFATCASAMMQCLAPDAKITNKIEREIHIEADNIEQLLVNWLSEINFNITVAEEIYSSFTVNKLWENELIATVQGEKIDPKRHPFEMEIKAVTYHQLAITKIPDGWQARVIFDI